MIFWYFLLVHRAFGRTGCKKEIHLTFEVSKGNFTWFFILCKESLHVFLETFLYVCFWNLLISLLLFITNYPDVSVFIIFALLGWKTLDTLFKVWIFMVGTISTRGRSEISFQIKILMYVYCIITLLFSIESVECVSLTYAFAWNSFAILDSILYQRFYLSLFVGSSYYNKRGYETLLFTNTSSIRKKQSIQYFCNFT